ncbi:MAG: flavin reductase family protein [Armatimonadetes bacterium]|nr:flavin reductase family protein [Armatimonadota bacterium]
MATRSFSPPDAPTSLVYDLLVAAIAPRPIALVSTISSAGIPNLAPFSYFVIGGVNPASLCYCPANLKSGEPKDSLRNAEETGEFVVHMVNRAMVPGMNQTGVDYPTEVDEWKFSGFTPMKCDLVRASRIAESPIAFECRLFEIVKHGAGPFGTNYVIGEVVRIHAEESLFTGDALKPGMIRPVGRMGGNEYIDLNEPEISELARPILPS